MDLDHAAALWVLDALPPSHVQPVAWEAQAQGYDGPALRELAAAEWTTRHDVGDLFPRALAEAGRVLPPPRLAALTCARIVAAQIVAGALDPIDGARTIAIDFWATGDRATELAKFVSLYDLYVYDSSAGRHVAVEYAALFRAEAERLLAALLPADDER